MKKRTQRLSLSIVIPCLNEIQTISRAVKRAHKVAAATVDRFEIIVADNGSTDGTVVELKKLQKAKLCSYVAVSLRGYGSALHHGLLKAKYPYVLYADADLSYDFGEIKKFLSYQTTKHDLVLGSRLRGVIDRGAMPFLHRYLGTPVLSLLIRWFYRLPLSDSNSGMRMVRLAFYKKLRMKYSGMEWASELLIRTARWQGKYAEVPIHFHKDKRKTQPHLKRWADGWRHLKVIILMAPLTLVYAALIIFALSLLFVGRSLFTTIALSLFSEVLIFAYLLVKKLDATTEAPNQISLFLDKLPLVQAGILVNLIGIGSVFLVADTHLYSKYILIFQVVLYNLWLFFIETVNTHLVNRLDIRRQK